ncbi:MAG: hypothetical protein DI598_00500 [Pseudopedobacter saltans]|uniref:Uncharacterized protein n=1 Tax=Pseudopedobacter saltans TaxID=151895 RepID=A0A2W5HFS2_9SPHI|nr:MAG: hypothetical protein DI598_00500 [Pseudopedobacter saltans]
MGLLYGTPGLVWMANPLLLLSWIFNKKKIALIFGILAIIAALSFLFIKRMIADEAGHYSSIDQHYLGYWLWLSSIVLNMGNVLYQKYLLSKKTSMS